MVKLYLQIKQVPYLYRSSQVGPFLAEVEKAGNGYPIGQIVDKGHIVDQVVCLPNTQDDNCGKALLDRTGSNKRKLKHWISVLKLHSWINLLVWNVHRAAGQELVCSFLGGSLPADKEGDPLWRQRNTIYRETYLHMLYTLFCGNSGHQ